MRRTLSLDAGWVHLLRVSQQRPVLRSFVRLIKAD